MSQRLFNQIQQQFIAVGSRSLALRRGLTGDWSGCFRTSRKMQSKKMIRLIIHTHGTQTVSCLFSETANRSPRSSLALKRNVLCPFFIIVTMIDCTLPFCFRLTICFLLYSIYIYCHYDLSSSPHFRSVTFHTIDVFFFGNAWLSPSLFFFFFSAISVLYVLKQIDLLLCIIVKNREK